MVERVGKRRTDSIREQKLEKRREGWLGREKKKLENEKFKRSDRKKYGAPTINGRTHINLHPLSHLSFNLPLLSLSLNIYSSLYICRTPEWTALYPINHWTSGFPQKKVRKKRRVCEKSVCWKSLCSNFKIVFQIIYLKIKYLYVFKQCFFSLNLPLYGE